MTLHFLVLESYDIWLNYLIIDGQFGYQVKMTVDTFYMQGSTLRLLNYLSVYPV